jgi:hypothetical protein
MAKYVIIDTTEITAEDSVIDFNKLMNRGSSYLRYNNDGNKAVLKYDGDQPSFLNGKTEYTHAEILVEMNKSEWVVESED